MDDELKRMLMQLMEGQTEIKLELKSVNERISKVEVKLETLEKKVDTIAEVQQSHMKQNENQHIDIVEMVSEKLEIQDKVIKNIKAVK